jgi:para-nitrobenzyl esterase
MKKLYSSLLTLSLIFAATAVDAQCPGLRYKDQIFPNLTKTADVLFGNNINVQGNAQDLFLDVYEPTGDTETNRPVIIFAHGGSFIGGSKDGTDVVPLCEDFAKMGYVTVSIDYRIGIENFPFPGPDSVDATEAVMRGYHDMKAAMRFLKKDVAINGNTYGIDPSRIIVGGVSAGGFLALHLAYLDEVSEIPTYIDTTQAGMGGGLAGNSGNPGYSTDDAIAVLNYAGALRDTAWMKVGDEPIISLHGNNDNTVPYGSDIITLLGVYPLLQVDGSFSVHARANELGITNCFDTQENQDHVPQVSNPVFYDTVVVLTRNFLQHIICGDPLDCFYRDPVSVSETMLSSHVINVYPNPAEQTAQLDLSEFENENLEVVVYDNFGRLVRTYNNVMNATLTIERGDLSAGIYMVNVIDQGYLHNTKLVFE